MDRMIYPDYTFRDLNLKFAGTNKAGDHYGISAVMGEDRFSYLLDVESEHSRYDYEDHEHNRQLGVSAYYQKNGPEEVEQSGRWPIPVCRKKFEI